MDQKDYTAMAADFKERIEKISEAFFSEVIHPLSICLKEIRSVTEAAEADMKASVDAYKSDLASRQANLNGKIDHLKGIIEQSEMDTSAAVEALSAAISADDEQAEMEAKQAVDAASEAEFIARRRLEALSRVELIGNDDLYFDAIIKCGALVKAEHEISALLSEIQGPIEEIVTNANAITKKFKTARTGQFYTRKGIRYAWPVIVSHGGPVDFSGATAGVEEDCRIRYLEALAKREYDPGFMDSPAGPRLSKDITELYDYEEQREAALSES